jgi:RNA recognition motif-containing protein
MNTRIYFDNLPATVTEAELMDLFSAHGNVVNVRIVTDRTNAEPRGFGFVTMMTPEGARAAIQFLNGKIFGQDVLTLSELPPDKEPSGLTNGRPVPLRRASHLY